MASSKACLMAALCTIIIFTTFIGSTQSASCCLRYVKRPLRCIPLLGYTIQTINTSCDINAVIFHIPGRFVCANPSAKWTQRGKQCVDERMKKAAQAIREGTQSNSTSA